jgi:hypothetical protein
VKKVADNTKPFLLQTYRRDMGGGNFVLMKDLSSPIVVRGRQLGRIPYGFSAELDARTHKRATESEMDASSEAHVVSGLSYRAATTLPDLAKCQPRRHSAARLFLAPRFLQSRDVLQQALAGQDEEVIAKLRILK